MKIKINAHKWDRHPEEFYTEPSWVSKRLFEEEPFKGSIWDPCCGTGTIPLNAISSGFNPVYASDIIERVPGITDWTGDFLLDEYHTADNLIFNSPYNIIEPFVRHAVTRAKKKVAFVIPVARLNAARWLQELPLVRVWLLTPRPSMPPGELIIAGEKAKGGKIDFAWAIIEHNYQGSPELKWLHRDQNRNS